MLGAGLGATVSSDERSFVQAIHQKNYTGDAGRQRLRLSTNNLRDRDGLHGRPDSLRCPVLWMHGTADQVYSVPNAQDEISRFLHTADAELRIVEGGQHFVSASDPDDVNATAVAFINRWK